MSIFHFVTVKSFPFHMPLSGGIMWLAPLVFNKSRQALGDVLALLCFKLAGNDPRPRWACFLIGKASQVIFQPPVYPAHLETVIGETTRSHPDLLPKLWLGYWYMFGSRYKTIFHLVCFVKFDLLRKNNLVKKKFPKKIPMGCREMSKMFRPIGRATGLPRRRPPRHACKTNPPNCWIPHFPGD